MAKISDPTAGTFWHEDMRGVRKKAAAVTLRANHANPEGTASAIVLNSPIIFGMNELENAFAWACTMAVVANELLHVISDGLEVRPADVLTESLDLED